MAQTKVVIVFSPNLRSRRTVIIPDDDSQISVHVSNLQPGESVVVGSLSDYQTLGPDVMLSRQFSQSASNHRCIVVNAFGVVTDVVMMDPQIDQHPHGQLLHDPLGLALVGQSV